MSKIKYADLHGTALEQEIRRYVSGVLRHHDMRDNVIEADLTSAILAHLLDRAGTAARLAEAVITLMNHIEEVADVVGDGTWDKIDVDLWNKVTHLASEERKGLAVYRYAGMARSFSEKGHRTTQPGFLRGVAFASESIARLIEEDIRNG